MKNVLLFAGLYLGIGLFSGCEKYLETAPDMRAEIDSPEKVSELLTSAYPRASYIPFLESMSDNAGDKGAAAGSNIYINSDPWMFLDVRNRNVDSPDYYWYACYAAIAASNRALAVIEALGDTEAYQSHKGEALLARAYAHFMLVALYAKTYNPITSDTDPGIPYVTEPEETVLKKYERKTVSYVYEQIEADLVNGLKLLDDNRYSVPKYHFTVAAAHAFAARFYLFKRSWTKVIQHASSVFPSGTEGDYLRPINAVSYRSMEYYSKQADYTIATNPANLLLVEAPSVWGRSFSSYRYGVTTPILSQLFFASNVTGGRYAYMIYGGTELVYNMPKFREHFVRTDINANYGTPYNIIPLFSAEEVLMNRAEAYAMSGEFDLAIADLNTFASKKVFASEDQPVYSSDLHAITVAKLTRFYNTASLEQSIVEATLDFKRREFVFEGLRYLDILRHQLTVSHTSNDGKDTYELGPNDPRRVLQIPLEASLSGMEINPR
ncbi:RagB/SusD family nutrient uptake outer membrane protein [Sphingobacterium sp. LRF_L2]|uniref:RagB/SusD family nutrient uptake outer membrane protein n=1 Tax=Sphingobacterium sp. LRF_L2 TaxID=3369421 RepID=UPI003F622A2E